MTSAARSPSANVGVPSGNAPPRTAESKARAARLSERVWTFPINPVPAIPAGNAIRSGTLNGTRATCESSLTAGRPSRRDRRGDDGDQARPVAGRGRPLTVAGSLRRVLSTARTARYPEPLCLGLVAEPRRRPSELTRKVGEIQRTSAMELSGFEPLTSWVRSRRSPS